MTTGDTHAVWEAILDRLELDLVQNERMLATGEVVTPEPWEVPRVDGPIPTGLLPRAHEIQRRQAEIRAALRVALTVNGRQRAYADRVTQSRDTGLTPAAYVDLNA